MVTQSVDTHPKIEQVQILLLRQASVTKRIWITRSLSQTVIQLSRQAILRAHAGLTDRELGLTFVAYHYGSEAARRLGEYLEQKRL